MKDSPIIKQIVLFGILSAIISLMLACFGFGIYEFYKIKNEFIIKTNSQLDILAYSLQSTLLFDDKEAANRILLALRDDRSVNRVRVFRANGREFTSFIHVNKDGDIKLVKDITYDHIPIGRLEIEAVYLGIKDEYITFLGISLLIIILSIPASYFISEPIRKQVSLGVSQLEKQSNRLRKLADQVVSTEQQERKRIAAIIHDHLQQILVAGKLQVSLVLREMKKKEYDRAAISLLRLEEFLDEATRAAKTLTVELRPPVLYEDGLAAAFQWLAKKFKHDHDLEVSLELDEIPHSALTDNLKIMTFESVKELLFNVVKYSGIHEAELSLKYAPGYIVVRVKDNGYGFDISHMGNRSSDKGFGLFSIRERLRLLNGDLKIDSQPGKGTTIEMTIPVKQVVNQSQVLAQVSTENNTIDRRKKSKTIKVLLVDDHKVVREGLANLLNENAAFEVVAQAENGEEAVAKAGIFLPDVVIMDINMPKLNGIEATRAIKNKFSNIKVIGLSVQNEDDVTESMKKAGAVALLNKAGDPKELMQLILNHRP